MKKEEKSAQKVAYSDWVIFGEAILYQGNKHLIKAPGACYASALNAVFNHIYHEFGDQDVRFITKQAMPPQEAEALTERTKIALLDELRKTPTGYFIETRFYEEVANI